MDFSIATILGLDGVTSGAIYALVAIALVLVFAVTRIVFIPQGEYVAFGALDDGPAADRPGAGHGVAAAPDGRPGRRDGHRAGPARTLAGGPLAAPLAAAPCCCRWWRPAATFCAGAGQAAAAGAGRC
jgi:branched-chain amino acid transport system permease protein